MDSKPNKKRLSEFLDEKNGNIINLLDDHDVGLIGSDVISEFEEDFNDPDYQKKRNTWKKGQKLVRQEVEEKNTPFKKAANVKYPLLTTASIQFASRAYPEIVQGRSVVKPKIVGEEPQVEEMPQGLPQEQQQQFQLAQQEEEKNRASKIERAETVCRFINWQLFNEIEEWEEDTDKLMGMLPLYGSMFRCVYYSTEKNRVCTELLSPEKLILPYKAKSIRDTPRISKEFTLYPRQVISKVRSKYYSEAPDFDDEDKEAPEEFIEQYKWLDLDEDGFKEPYIVTVHKESSKCVRISPNYRMEDILVNDDNEIYKINDIKYFTKYTFIPSTDESIYDLGFFDLLYPINAVINTTINQLLDTGTRNNSGSGFIAGNLGIRKKGPVTLKNGEFKTIQDDGGDIRKKIYQMDWGQPSPVLFQLLGFMVDAGRDIGNLKEVLEGDSNPNQTATATMALIEQGLKVFSGIYTRIHRSLSIELKMIRFWNHEIRNPLYGEVVDKRFTQEDFADDDLDFVPVSDPRVVTDMQKMGRVQFLLQFLNDPYFDQMKLREEIFEGASIDGFEELKAGQDPEKAQLQQQLQQAGQAIQQLQQAIQELQKDKDFEKKTEMIELDTKAEESKAKVTKDYTASVKNIADAEAAEDGTQIESYKAQVERIDGKGSISGVGGSPRNPGSQTAPRGPAPRGNGPPQQSGPVGTNREGLLQALSQMQGKTG